MAFLPEATNSNDLYGGKDADHLEHVHVPLPADQPDAFPTRKVTAFGGVGLFVMQAFQVAADYGVIVVQSVRELVMMAVAGFAAWWTKERRNA